MDIFADLEALCASPGFIHSIAYLSARDTMFHFQGEATPDDLATMHAAGRLIRNEVNVLIGILVKQEIDYSAPDAGTFERHVSQSESLLDEMHHAMEDACEIWFRIFQVMRALGCEQANH
jgi:hypothetical protein